MKILVMNSGSSSLKYKLFDMTNESELISGHLDGIGLDRCSAKLKTKGAAFEKKVLFKDHLDAILFAFKSLKEHAVIRDFSEITGVGHRVVHGGEYYSDSVIITDLVVKRIKELSEIAPLHNPPNLAGILACRKILSKVPQVAVFDTAFHQSMSPENFLYALPHEFYKKHKIRRYGFHGISHKFVSEQAGKILGKKDSKIITCHLGNGASVTAIRNGKSVATSMGFTPLEGLIMGTRSGSFDPAIITYLTAHKEFGIKNLNDVFNKQSGLLAISGSTSDVRDLRKKAVAGDERAKLALSMFANRVAFYIGGYASLLNGVDAIVFAGGIGEGGWFVRKDILAYLDYLGVKYDVKANRKNEIVVSSKDSRVKVYVIPTNEELQIARETKNLLKK